VDRIGNEHERLPGDYKIGYRSVVGPEGEWFLSVTLQLKSGDVEVGQNRIRELLGLRNSKQPIGQPSCGSVFRNPEGGFAAKLIEAVGLKGLQMGGAQVSEKHANFIINTGNATAIDIENLILHIQQEVEKESGVKLHTEVHVVGDRGTR